MSAVAVDTNMRFHLSLNVSDLERSVQFLSILLGCEPVKWHSDYAKFEPEWLPLVLSLEPRRRDLGSKRSVSGLGALNHLGFRTTDAAALIDVQRRLELAGIKTDREEGVECCYARQTKFWVTDPDQNLWEIYILESDIEHRGNGQVALNVLNQPISATATTAVAGRELTPRNTWLHRLADAFPEQLEAGTLDEVYLEGTFNNQRFAASKAEVLGKSLVGLRPGGKLLIHALTTNHRLEAAPPLNGLAAVVSHLPHDRELMAEVAAAGFVGVQLVKFGDRPCFHFHGIEMRETELLAWKPGGAESETCVGVIYKGPFAQVTDECGQVFPRGQRMMVDTVTRDRLQQGAGASQFAFPETLDPSSAGCCS